MDMQKELSYILLDIENTLSNIEDSTVQDLMNRIKKVQTIFFIGAGRSKLVLATFCMRLQHLGYKAYMVGDLYCPPADKNDLAIVATGSGITTSSIEHAKRFKEFGGEICLLTGNLTALLGKIADLFIFIPTSPSLMYKHGEPIMRSSFEQALFIFLEIIIRGLSEGIDPSIIISRHANIE